MSKYDKILDHFGIFKELVEKTAQDVYRDTGFLKPIIVLLTDDKNVALLDWTTFSLRSCMSDKEKIIKAMAFVNELDDHIQIRVIDEKTKYGTLYKKENKELIETNKPVDFDDIEKIFLEVTNAQKEETRK